MTQWLYLAFGFALFLILGAKKKIKKGSDPFLKRGLTPFVSSIKLMLALVAVMEMDWLLNSFLWASAGRSEFRMISLLLLALLMGEGREEIFLPLAGFSIWMITKEKTLSFSVWAAAGLTLPLATGAVKTLLEGCLKRLELSDIPKAFQGAPITFWLASLLALAFQGWGGLARLFVNYASWVKL